MRHHDDRDYFAARTIEEMDLGDGAATPTVAAVHYELAHRYAKLAGRTDVKVSKLTLVEAGSAYLAADAGKSDLAEACR